MTISTRTGRTLGLAVVALTGCFVVLFFNTSPPLGPIDGRDLPAVDTGRVAVGDVAPDFRLRSFTGDIVTLSDYRSAKDVVLVFYRGHW